MKIATSTRTATRARAGYTPPATLIGCSLGGLYAREIGKLMAPRIRQGITMGTPFNAQADHTNPAGSFACSAAVRR